MSVINGLGQGVYQFYQNAKVSSAHEIATPVTQNDPDGDGNDGTSGGNRKKGDVFGMALLATLAKHGVDAEEFQHDFLAAIRELNGGIAVDEEPKVPFSAVG
jgi:hypothetical protein